MSFEGGSTDRTRTRRMERAGHPATRSHPRHERVLATSRPPSLWHPDPTLTDVTREHGGASKRPRSSRPQGWADLPTAGIDRAEPDAQIEAVESESPALDEPGAPAEGRSNAPGWGERELVDPRHAPPCLVDTERHGIDTATGVSDAL
jgi:hypothetical protein